MFFRRSVGEFRRRAASAIAGSRAGPLAGMRWALLLVVVALFTAGCYNSTSGDSELLGISFKLPVFPKTGSHKVMVFSEMHYQRSYRVQDVPRVLPPSDAVAYVSMGGPDGVTRAEMIRQELVYSSLVEYTGLEAPERVVQSYDAGRSAELFRVNCVMCHGVSMEGDGPIATLMTVLPVKVAVEERDPKLSQVPVPKKLGPAPANLTLPLTQDSSEGDIFAYITLGGRQGSAAVFRGNETRSPMPPFQWLLSEDDRWALVRYVLDR